MDERRKAPWRQTLWGNLDTLEYSSKKDERRKPPLVNHSPENVDTSEYSRQILG